MHPRMIYKTFNPELPRQTKCSTDLLVSIFKQTVEQNVPYATFFRSAMPAVNGAFSNSFVEQWAMQSTVLSADERVPRESPVIVAKSTVNRMRQLHMGCRNLRLSPVVGGRWPAMRRTRNVGEESFQPPRILTALCLRSFWVLELLVQATRPDKSLEIF